eukprot:TRINITY_DN47852_c0_g1_i1.p1 TRINITY_DN47852_c0_g1~~TRINITY_DN47852_c0_g1_i1.p1  ORF type:complete len:307 (+),score=47.94 TRINITY_DN47852_c0_g1_i1:77-997(+)
MGGTATEKNKYPEQNFSWPEIWVPVKTEALVDLSPCACQLNDYYYYGNIGFAKEEGMLAELGITHILSLTRQKLPENVRERFNCKQIQVSDTPQTSISQKFQTAFDHIEAARRAGGKIFVHCRAGVSRVSCVTIAFLMTDTRLPLKDAYLYVKQRRPVAHPNKGFLSQLINYETMLLGESPHRGLDMGVLPYAVWERVEHLRLNNPIPPLEICLLTEEAVKEAYWQKYGRENPYRTLDAGLGGKMGLHCVHLYSVNDFDIVDWGIRTVLAPGQNVGSAPPSLHDWPPGFIRSRLKALLEPQQGVSV